ncbi:MAG: hypothetical protein SNH63_05825 [Rikenellaceae bacterium]
MKIKLLIATILGCLISTTGLMAKSTPNLRFLDVEITGSVESFADSMALRGFAKIENRDGDATRMKGQFINRDCTIELITNAKKRNVEEVRVTYDGVRVWDALWAYFEYFEDLLCKEYGACTAQNRTIDESVADKVFSFHVGNSRYDSTWKIDKGHQITLAIVPRDYSTAGCQISYLVK